MRPPEPVQTGTRSDRGESSRVPSGRYRLEPEEASTPGLPQRQQQEQTEANPPGPPLRRGREKDNPPWDFLGDIDLTRRTHLYEVSDDGEPVALFDHQDGAAARNTDKLEELTSLVKSLVRSQASRDQQVENESTRQDQR